MGLEHGALWEFGVEVVELREELKDLDERDEERGLLEGEGVRQNEVMAQLLLQLKNRKSLLIQKAKFRWLKDGDVNSRMFHRAINRGRCSNRITGLELGGEWVDEPGRVKVTIFEHFWSHFQKREGIRVEMPSCLVETRLEEGDYEGLTRIFTEEEVRETVWECDINKSPGPDGYNFGFFMECWDIVREDVTIMGSWCEVATLHSSYSYPRKKEVVV